MPFPNQGQNHSIGIQNEKQLVNYLMNNLHCTINKYLEKIYSSSIQLWKHEGGTKQKMDASFQLENGKIFGVSIKNHKTGTFDWINTTKGVSESLKEKILNFKKNNIDMPIPKKGGIRTTLENIFSLYLDNLTSKDITELLNKSYKIEENTNFIIINNNKSKQLIMLNESNLDLYCNPNHNHEFILKRKNAKTSRQIWIKKDEIEINTHLRIRLTLNNGITALLGRSKCNKTSVPSLKIQQDNVDEFISKCSDKIITNY